MAMEPEDTDDSELAGCLSRLAVGDLSARDRIIELCAGRLRNLAHRMLRRFPNVRRWDDTDDVFQNAALRLHRALGQLDSAAPRSVMALAATQLHRELIDLARKHAGPASYAANHGTNVIRGGLDRDDAPLRHVDRAADAAAPLDRWEEFHAAVERLPDDSREVFQLAWYLGADQKTIASLVGCSERTVKTRWRDAREAIRSALDDLPPE
jgi:RNA polymerase sigma-70 factor (ECF subfamily)